MKTELLYIIGMDVLLPWSKSIHFLANRKFENSRKVNGPCRPAGRHVEIVGRNGRAIVVTLTLKSK